MYWFSSVLAWMAEYRRGGAPGDSAAAASGSAAAELAAAIAGD